MTAKVFTESVVEEAALAWLEALGYAILSGPEIAPDQSAAERKDYEQVILESRLRRALQRLNPRVPAGALEEALRKLTRPDMPTLVVGMLFCSTTANRLVRAHQEITLLREEVRIKDARMARIDPLRRPHYPPTERMAVLALKWAKRRSPKRRLVQGCVREPAEFPAGSRAVGPCHRQGRTSTATSGL